jgi:hypothetical protein
LSTQGSQVWAAGHGYRLDDSFGHPLAREVPAPLRFRIPSDAGKRVALARVLWEATGAGTGETLVWVTERGIWPSGEHLPLAEAVRRGFGAELTLHEAPGHLARLGEDDAALSVLCLAVLFLWDCWILPSGGRPAVFVSHDEYGIVDTRGDDMGLAERLSMLGVADHAERAI